MSLVCGREVEITNVLGLHLRAAERFVRLARTFVSSISLSNAGNTANGKSILDLACLAAAQGTRVEIHICGPDCHEALAALTQLIESGFAEESESPRPQAAHVVGG